MRVNTLMISLVASMLWLGAASGLVAETLKNRVDFTGQQQVSEDDIITALTPVKFRGLNTRGLQPGLATIALTVNFAFDSEQLLPEAIPNLRSLGRALQSPQLAPYRIRIEGHTDSIGTQIYNQELSQRRANAVKAYLVQHFDIKPDNLDTAGRGEAEPLDDNGTSQGRQRNRRAEFVNLGK
jgi:outer membrane protein OmpA-like peptidoglycan-associated protein